MQYSTTASPKTNADPRSARESLDVRNITGFIQVESTNGSAVQISIRKVVRAETRDDLAEAQRDVRLDFKDGAPRVGDVYSDFDVQLAASASVVQENRSSNGRYRISRSRSIVGAINGGGPEVEQRTFNSNVHVRKGRQQLERQVVATATGVSLLSAAVDTPHLLTRLTCPSCNKHRGVLLATSSTEATYLWCEACGHIWKLAPAVLTTH